MEKSENQIKYVKELKPFIDSIPTDGTEFEDFIKEFKKHEYFKYCTETVEKFLNDENYGKCGLKVFIFSMFTQDREGCAALIQLLSKSNLNEQAHKLRQFNISSGPIPLQYTIELKIMTRPYPFKDLSSSVCLLSDKRGKCIIINNVENAQEPPYCDHGQRIEPIGLKRDTERFRYIFEELFFDVEVILNKNSKQMKEELTKISKDTNLKNSEAFVLIVISHGQDEKVLGYDACEALRQINFEEIKQDDLLASSKANQVIKDDQVEIKDLVSIFSEEECEHLRGKPKLHFYVCCRINGRSHSKSQQVNSEDGKRVKMTEIKPEPKKYRETFISYACAEGFKSYYDKLQGLSDFGQAFTHSIAQYACESSLNGIMTRTSKRLEDMYSMWETDPNKRGSYEIEVNTYAMSNELYFNPGHRQMKTS